MPKQEGQKSKLLALLRIFEQQTDENHLLNVPQLVDCLLYTSILKNGALENLYQFARLDRKVAVVTDSGVPAEYAQRVADQCRESTIIKMCIRDSTWTGWLSFGKWAPDYPRCSIKAQSEDCLLYTSWMTLE